MMESERTGRARVGEGVVASFEETDEGESGTG